MSSMKGKRTEQDSLGLVEVPQDVYEMRPRKDRDGFDLISDRLRNGPIWYAGPDAIRNAVAYAKYRSRSHRAIIRVFNEEGNVTETHESATFRRPSGFSSLLT